MTVALREELTFLLVSLLFGVLFGILYDAFRFLRELLGIRTKNARVLARLLTVLLDFLCVLSGGVFYTVLIYAHHNGVFRFYSLFALLFGTLLYMKTLSRAVLLLLLPAAKGIRRVLRCVFNPFYKLFYAFSCIFLRIIRKIHCVSRKIVINYNKKKENKQNKKKPQKNTDEAKCHSAGTYVFGKR